MLNDFLLMSFNFLLKRKGKKIIFSHRYIKIRVDKSQFLNIAKKEKTAEKRG